MNDPLDKSGRLLYVPTSQCLEQKLLKLLILIQKLKRIFYPFCCPYSTIKSTDKAVFWHLWELSLNSKDLCLTQWNLNSFELKFDATRLSS